VVVWSWFLIVVIIAGDGFETQKLVGPETQLGIIGLGRSSTLYRLLMVR